MELQTIGFSKKVLATVLTACGAQAVALIVNWISTEEFNRTEWAGLIGIALTATLGTLAGYLAKPNPVANVAEPPPPPPAVVV